MTAVTTRVLNPLDQSRKLVAASVAAMVFLLLAALSGDDSPVLCVFRRCTGGYCPGCGLTRSGGRLLRGDVAGSIEHHPYLIFGVVQAVVGGAAWRFASTGLRQRMLVWLRPLLVINGAALVTIWIIRMTDGSIPVPFVG